MAILAVDDSRIMRRLISGAIEVLGYEMLEAGNGVEALEVLEKSHEEIDLILLDWNMPEMDGFTALQKIQEDERFKNIPVMMVTTESERENMVKAIQAGAKNYLSKPFTQEDLTSKIAECLGMGFE